MTKKKQKKVYVPPVAEQLAIVEEIQLLGYSTRLQHSVNSSTPPEIEIKEGMEISSEEAYKTENW